MFEAERFGKVISGLREARNKRQIDLAMELNISEGYISKIETGTAENLSTEMMILILNYFKICYGDCILLQEQKTKLLIQNIAVQTKGLYDFEYDYLINSFQQLILLEKEDESNL